MEPKKNPKADLENKRAVFFQIGLVIALGITLLAFEWKTYEATVSDLGQLQMEEIEEEIIPITQQQTPPPPPPPPPPPQEILEIVEDDEEIENEVVVQDMEADMETEIFEQPEMEIEEEQIFISVEHMPTFSGCENESTEQAKQSCTYGKIMQYVSKNVDYPAMAKDAGIEGRVFITFVIDAEGEVTDVELLRGVPGGELLDKEAVRVVQSMPDFNPGRQRGKAVSVRYNLPVNFTLR